MAIRLKGISLSYGEKRIFDGFDLQLPERGILCVTGPSGCGKTTLLRLCCGLIRPQAGEVTGVAPGDAAVMFQEDRLLPWLTARENVAAVLPKPRAIEAEHFLELTELSGDGESLPKELSGGQRRRVSLARALAYGGRLLALDEPFKGIDAPLRARLMPLIAKAAEDKPVLLITHDPEEPRLLGAKCLELGVPAGGEE